MAVVYLITNTVNGKQYIGFTTKTIEKRWCRHVYMAMSRGSKLLLHNAIREYGPSSFCLKTLFVGSTRDALEKEISLIAVKNTRVPNGYNSAVGGRVPHGYKRKHSEETREKMHIAHLGVKLSVEHRQHLSNSLKGRVCTAETRARISDAHTGKPQPWNRGPKPWSHRPLTAEWKAKISASLMGHKGWNKGKKMPSGFGQKISASLMGNKRACKL